MPLQTKFNFGAIQITANAKDELELFRAISIFGELPCQCGQCDSKNVFPSHRQTEEKDDYYNLRCRDCGAQFDVGQKKAGGLFPKYNPKDRVKCQNGWYHFADQDFGKDKGGSGRRDDDRGDRRDTRRDDDRRDTRREEPKSERRRDSVPDDSDEIPF